MLPKRYRFIEVGLMLAAIAAMLMPILTYSAQSPAAYLPSAQSPATYLPIVANKTNAQATSFTTLIDHDTTFVNAANIPGTCRVIVTYIDRANGNRLHVTEDMFNRLVEISMTVEMQLAIGADYLDPQPTFVYPGPKHASGFPIIVCNELWIYANARDVGDVSGPFKLKRLTMPIPPKPTQ